MGVSRRVLTLTYLVTGMFQLTRRLADVSPR